MLRMSVDWTSAKLMFTRAAVWAMSETLVHCNSSCLVATEAPEVEGTCSNQGPQNKVDIRRKQISSRLWGTSSWLPGIPRRHVSSQHWLFKTFFRKLRMAKLGIARPCLISSLIVLRVILHVFPEHSPKVSQRFYISLSSSRTVSRVHTWNATIQNGALGRQVEPPISQLISVKFAGFRVSRDAVENMFLCTVAVDSVPTG